MAAELDDAGYKCNLSEASKKKAREELHELNDKDREIAVQTLRQWVLQQDWLKTPTDFRFLLRFLRARKFSQLGARENLGKYWRTIAESPQISRNLDPEDEIIQKVIRTGFFCCPKALDQHGRRLLIICPERADANVGKDKLSVEDTLRGITLILQWLIYDENVQINGICVLANLTDIRLGFFAHMLGNESGKKHLEFFEHGMPSRMKGMHMYNEPTFFDAIFAFLSPIFSKKTKARIHLHGRSLVKLYEHVDKSVLPREYLPDEYDGPCPGTLEEIMEETIAELKKPEFRNYIVQLSSDKYGVDLKKKVTDDQVPVASFRKLNVD